MTSSRQGVLDYLAAQRAATADETARALGMSAPNARRHLNALRVQGLVEMMGNAPCDGAGRPAALYRLAAVGPGKGLEPLTAALLDVFVAGAAEDAVLNALAARLAGLKPGGDVPPPAARPNVVRLNAVIRQLNQLGYQARWEAHASGPRIILGRCPYAAVLEGRPELCRMDVLLVGQLIASPLALSARLKPDRRGVPFCLLTPARGSG